MSALLTGRSTELDRPAEFDPALMVRQVVARTKAEFENAGVHMVMMTPAQLPLAKAHADRVESALVQLLVIRLADSQAGATLTLSARVVPSEGGDALLLSVVDPMTDSGDGLPPELDAALETLGSETLTLTNPLAGRVTSLQIPLASG